MLRKHLIIVAILLAILIAVLGLHVCIKNSTKQIEFQTISKGYYSGHKKPAYYAIKNEDEWADVWNQHESISLPQCPLPEVNFSETTIIAVFMGEFNTGGYGIEIKEILDMSQSVVAKVEKTYPGKG